jgi:hypothetical protein
MTIGFSGSGSETSSINTTGNVWVKGGVLSLATATSHITGGAQVKVDSGATLHMNADDTIAGGSFAGLGTIMMNAAVDGSGAMKTLTTKGATWKPAGSGATGQLTVNGNLTLDASAATASALEIELGAGTADLLHVTGAVTLTNAALNVLAAATPRVYTDTTVTILDGSSVTGTFAAVTKPYYLKTLGLTYNADNVQLTYAYHLPGDANDDGIVDQVDYKAWHDNFNTVTSNWSDGDFNGDHLIDQADYKIWHDNFNTSIGGSVPEPTTMALLAIAGGTVLVGLRTNGFIHCFQVHRLVSIFSLLNF